MTFESAHPAVTKSVTEPNDLLTNRPGAADFSPCSRKSAAVLFIRPGCRHSRYYIEDAGKSSAAFDEVKAGSQYLRQFEMVEANM
jgi:hypothetical protein